MCNCSNLSTFSPTLIFLNNSHADWCEAVSHCGSHLFLCQCYGYVKDSLDTTLISQYLVQISFIYACVCACLHLFNSPSSNYVRWLLSICKQ